MKQEEGGEKKQEKRTGEQGTEARAPGGRARTQQLAAVSLQA